MPPSTRSKRVFAVISPNAPSKASPKRKSTRKASGENNNATSAKTTLRSHNPRKPTGASRKKAATTSKTAKVDVNAHPKTWICICEDGVRHRCNVSPDCMCMRLADRKQGYRWVITKKGADLYQEWRWDQWKRDAEAMGVLTYTDYSGYGTGEVVENMLCAFDTVISSKRKYPWVIWAHIEGIARFLSQDNWKWYHIDDSETNAKRVMLIGTAILTAIDHLIGLEKFNDDGEIRNIGFILGLLLQFTLYFKKACAAHEDGWQISVVKKADEYGVTIRSLDGIGLLVFERREPEESGSSEDEDTEKSDEHPNFIKAYEPAPYNPVPANDTPEVGESRSWDKWDWKQELAAYSQQYGVNGKIGGDQYDLTAAHNLGMASSEGSVDIEYEREEHTLT